VDSEYVDPAGLSSNNVLDGRRGFSIPSYVFGSSVDFETLYISIPIPN
jgi:hypothetical protein